ncbi:hypothetical protein [Ruegeria arenilitoris]|uniref:Alpha/beta hydrolase family protein n=1 Tax=Ruegeria arenilitoris TaxID=1173585 RepID=A0A238JUV0_9RHOB|nr:hypothetical protein [Ruegeria arenilitoris]SMX34365.1 hypothetical protein RUA8715_00416 [Ruegeria arenilitoris]
MSSQVPQSGVQRRRVFYIPGYDPIHPRRYRELYRTEGRAQSGISGYRLEVSAKTGDGPYGWYVRSEQDGAEMHTDVEVLVWSDIVRESMDGSIPATYWQLLRTAWIYISTGTLWRLMWLRKGPVIAALYPVAMLLGQLALAGLVFYGVAMLSASAMHWLAEAVEGPALFGPYFAPRMYLSLALGMLAGWWVLRWFRKIDNRLFAYYLMHDYAYSARLRGETPPELQARMDEFRALIAEALRSPVDEVLVVGHSSGAHLGVSVLAELLRRSEVPPDGPALSFLTLGQVVPMVSFLPRADQLRADLQLLSQTEQLTWVDVSAPGDGCAFALCDPVAVSGVAVPGKRWPLVLSAAFTQTLSPEQWAALRWRFFRLHFQYLCAFDRPGDYDYFRITAGPLTLGARFAGRTPSKSRIERAVSKYRTVRA